MTQRYDYHHLKTLMQRLRTPGTGCPWDLEQTYDSIVPHTLEEVYEVIDTIERGDYAHLREELGDLVFQVVFYAQIAAEEQRFDLDDVIHDLVAKLISRHPHVFPAGTLESQIDPNHQTDAGTVNGQWDQLKDVEKQNSGRVVSLLDDVPRSLPGLLRARKLQKRAARVGFDWPDASGVFDKVDEELAELRDAAASGDADHIEEELGDLLFVIANLSRHLDVDPEQALRKAAHKFEARFSQVEAQVQAKGGDWSEHSLESLDDFWNQAKAKEPR
ncbi:MAG: nucleoside triphosphate pyrophosphohydrolase [Saccharospirillum sp.]|uniref:nucleoside triphosphate pyrophosphohydrolase n=1 Tax=Saccharospirillum sp. TaxID=2033801 RepID=UPI003297048F